ncbi:MAG: hypothetical protein GWO86_00110 [Planctomycetes bacterium]|nr:hypothetical protein [Planctomycetota bacterium]
MNKTTFRMRNGGCFSQAPKKYTIIFVTAVAIAALSGTAVGMPGYGRTKAVGVGGPWELLVQMGLEGQGLSFPVKVDDANKPQKLTDVLPVLGTPVKIRLVQYLPDLNWTTAAVEDPNGEIVVKLTVKGKGMKQDVWLSSDDPAKQSVSSRIGGIELKKLRNGDNIGKILREVTDPNAVGILTVWTGNTGLPIEYVIGKSKRITLPGSKYKVQVLDFLPHYSIDTKTKEVVNISEKPVNPAIKIRLSDGENTYEQWLWSNFPLYPHSKDKLPFRIQFTHFELDPEKGKYIIVAARGAEPWLLFDKEGKAQLEKIVLGQPYPFADNDYSFSIEKVFDNAVIKTDWKNGSEKLRNPAIIAIIEQDGTEQKAVLELRKPFHHKAASGTITLIFRPVPDNSTVSN